MQDLRYNKYEKGVVSIVLHAKRQKWRMIHMTIYVLNLHRKDDEKEVVLTLVV